MKNLHAAASGENEEWTELYPSFAKIAEEEGYPEGGIAPGTKWEDVPEDFECPLCNVGKDQFSEVE